VSATGRREHFGQPPTYAHMYNMNEGIDSPDEHHKPVLFDLIAADVKLSAENNNQRYKQECTYNYYRQNI
jgi:hypothetical protein